MNLVFSISTESEFDVSLYSKARCKVVEMCLGGMMGSGSDLSPAMNGGVAIDVFQGPVADATRVAGGSDCPQVQGSLASSRNNYLASR